MSFSLNFLNDLFIQKIRELGYVFKSQAIKKDLCINSEDLKIDFHIIDRLKINDFFAPCYINNKLHIFINHNISSLTKKEKADFEKQVKSIFQKHSGEYKQIENQLNILFNMMSK